MTTYVSLDSETTGLDHTYCQLLELGCIIEDTEKNLSYDDLPKFRRIVLHEKIVGEPIALAMNAGLISTISDRLKSKHGTGVNHLDDNVSNLNSGFCDIDDVGQQFRYWLEQNGYDTRDDGSVKIVVGGKNIHGFDAKFLYQDDNECYSHDAIDMTGEIIMHTRTIDPANMYLDVRTDKVPPSLSECKKRAGLEEEISHVALKDAWDVIRLVRHHTERTKNL